MQRELVLAAVKEGRNRTDEIVRVTGLEQQEVAYVLMTLRREGVLKHNKRHGWKALCE